MTAPPGYRVVFQLDDANPDKHEAVLRNVRNTVADLGPDVSVLVVAHGPGLGLLTGASGFADQLAGLVGQGVAFAACGNTMRRQEVPESALLPDVTVVSSGIGEVVRRQHDGWAYVRS